MVKIFVYGTLKEGFPLFNARCDDIKSVIKNVTVNGTLFDLGPFPAAKFNTDDTITGEIHTFNNKKETLEVMDRIEGYNSKNINSSLYIRKMIDVIYKNKKEKVYAYEFNFNRRDIKKNKIKTGIW